MAVRENPPSGDHDAHAPTQSGTFVILQPLPLEVKCGGRKFRLQIETESVSGESRLFGVDTEAERHGCYSAYLIALPARRAVLEAKIVSQGIESQGRAAFGMFSQSPGTSFAAPYILPNSRWRRGIAVKRSRYACLRCCSSFCLRSSALSW
jgi:hypothetical protein